MGVLRHAEAEPCVCCPPGAISTVSTTRPLGLAQRLAFIQAWRHVCAGSGELVPPEVMLRIFRLAATTQTRVVRRQVLTSFDALSLCGDASL